MRLVPVLLLLAAPALADETLTEPLIFRSTPLKAYEHGLRGEVPKGARVISFRAIDRNRNNCWEKHEIEAVFGPATRDVLATFDGNGDNRVTRREFNALDDGNGGPDGVLYERMRG